MGWNAALELLNRLAAWLDAYLRRRRAARRQMDRDRLEGDPPGWFRGHFGGMRDSEQPDSTGTDKADSERRGQSER
ncbi:hypothetical protein [Salinisphaera hydrothermalis]|uniref:hypothetical protein n=1 Tax=Salinisphaera hydrothermalis TaxID=563188 RepID=UPI0033406262